MSKDATRATAAVKETMWLVTEHVPQLLKTIAGLRATIDGLEARIITECKETEKVWVECQELKSRIRKLESKHAVYGGGDA